MGNVDFYLKDQQITKKILVVQNTSTEEKLFKIMINHDLYKLIFLKASEIKNISIDQIEINTLEVIEVSDNK